MKLTKIQIETLNYCKNTIDNARKVQVNLKTTKKRNLLNAKEILDAQNGIVFTQGGNCTIKTLRKLEKLGLLVVIEDNSGIGTSKGAFPSKVKILNY